MTIEANCNVTNNIVNIKFQQNYKLHMIKAFIKINLCNIIRLNKHTVDQFLKSFRIISRSESSDQP